MSGLKVGITGGIGSGKTTACKIFTALGVPIYYADDRAKRLMVDNEKVVAEIKDIFGKKAYLNDGSLNRQHLASIVFNDKEMLETLNAIVHPAVLDDSQKWHQQYSDQPYTLKEAALLIESGSHEYLDRLIVLTASEELRIERVMKRDGVSKKDVQKRMDNQLPEDAKIKLADFIIENDGKHSLVKQVWDIHRKLLEISLKQGQ